MNAIEQGTIARLMEKYGANKIGIRTLEVQVTNSLGKYLLPEDTILRDCQIFGFYTQLSGAGVTRYAPDSDRQLVSDAVISNSFLNLKCGNKDITYNAPLLQLAVSQGDRDIQPYFVRGLTVTQSYIQVSNPSTVLSGVSNQSFLLHFVHLIP
ncbi:MAG TPA: hypothetical protein PKD70_06255 [Saprospiraceae bacterium]|nr:hypothetical protein [Saprospiraceae bacterium]HMP13460.1 hypothetical protein [Saprospiraceae bacterium]